MGWIVIAGLVINFGGLVLGFLKLRQKQDEIRVHVDGRLDAALARGIQLTGALTAADVAVPPEPLPPVTPPSSAQGPASGT